MKYKKITGLMLSVAAIFGCGGFTSCNEKSSSESFLNPQNLAVTSFSLQADSKNPGLDSVYFSIDLVNRVIFNADSLRKGTKVDKVVPLISFNNTPSEATLIMSGGTTREGEVDFKTNPTDSIDFSGNVVLRLAAADGEISATYRIKVNVHKMETDSLFWDELTSTGLHTRLENPKAMKTVEIGDYPLSLVEESDGSYSVVKYDVDKNNSAEVEEIALPFTPQIHTLCASEDTSWILDESGMLWKGDVTLKSWQSTSETWSALIGVYNSSAVGLKKNGGQTTFAQYPALDINPVSIPADFPIEGFSNFVTLENKWTSSPVAFFAGGTLSDGSISDSTWAFDGSEWIKLSTGGIPALEGASVIPYYNFRASADGKSMIEYSVWLLLGGKMADGSFNRDVYISYDNGVNWSLGTSGMQLPEIIPPMEYCDNVVISLEKSANLADNWSRTSAPRRISYNVSNDIITWGCPYIYLFGGYSPEGKLYTTVWRGVLARLTFAPII